MFYNKVLFGVSNTKYTHRAHTQCICHKSTNSPFLCILSKDDSKHCRLFGLYHYHSHHWHHFCISVSESSVSNKLYLDTLAFLFAFLASASSCSHLSIAGVVRTSPVFAWTNFLCFFVFAKTDLVSSNRGEAITSMIAFWRCFQGISNRWET